MYIDKKQFEAYMERILERFEFLNRRLDKLLNTSNRLGNEGLLDNQDLCLLLKVSKRTLQRYRASGNLPFKRIGQKTYYLESDDVHQFLRHHFNES